MVSLLSPHQNDLKSMTAITADQEERKDEKEVLGGKTLSANIKNIMCSLTWQGPMAALSGKRVP